MPVTRIELSAGGVIYRGAGSNAEIALIAKIQKKIWCLPKGKIEKNESAEDAALREVKEETGLDGTIEGLLGDITYRFVSPVDKARVFKKVRFFLLGHTGGSTEEHDYEVDEVKWLDIGRALKIMSYSSERKILQIARRKLKK